MFLLTRAVRFLQLIPYMAVTQTDFGKIIATKEVLILFRCILLLLQPIPPKTV